MNARILATVSRSWSNWGLMKAELRRFYDRNPDAILVHGDAYRGDRDAAGIWHGMGGKSEAWPAKWMEHGDDCRCRDRTKRCAYAGLRRNVAMVETAPEACIAFIRKNSRGATHCAQTAEDAGIPTVRYVQGES